jgi:hypothetical protein
MPSQASSSSSSSSKVTNVTTDDNNANGFIAFDENNADDTTAAVAVAVATSEATATSATTATSEAPVVQTEFHALETDAKKCDPSILDLTEQMTKFLALDKCLPRRQFLSILNLKAAVPTLAAENENVDVDVDVDVNNKEENESTSKSELESSELPPQQTNKKKTKGYHIEYDPEWLAIIKKTHHWNSTQRQRVYIPSNIEPVNKSDIEWVIKRFKDAASDNDNDDATSNSSSFLEIPHHDFVPTVPYNTDVMFSSNNGTSRNNSQLQPLPMMGNPQTDHLLGILDLNHILTVPYDPIQHTPDYISNMYQGKNQQKQQQQQPTTQTKINVNMTTTDSNEIDLDDLDDDDDDNENNVAVAVVAVEDDNEIDIDDDDDDEDEDDSNNNDNNETAAVAVDDDNEIDIDDDDDDDDDDETMAKVTIKKARIEE